MTAFNEIHRVVHVQLMDGETHGSSPYKARRLFYIVKKIVCRLRDGKVNNVFVSCCIFLIDRLQLAATLKASKMVWKTKGLLWTELPTELNNCA